MNRTVLATSNIDNLNFIMKKFSAIILFTALSACVSNPSVKMGEYYPTQIENLENIAAEVEHRNDTLEQHPAWISMASQGFLLRDLSTVRVDAYENYRKYLDSGALYVIVHPAYSVFFNNDDPYSDSKDTVESFLNETAYTKSSRLIIEQERALRDFLEITSTRNRLIVLVLPDNSQEDRVGRDMFTLYVNSVTNGSDSVLYLYSEEPNRGQLSKGSRQQLIEFFRVVDPERIIIGGGYLGRCIEDFYRDFSSSPFGERMLISGEISAFKRDDLKDLDIDDFLKYGKLNIAALREVVSSKSASGITFKEILKNYKNYKNNKGQRG
jgi:hypothetical protein